MRGSEAHIEGRGGKVVRVKRKRRESNGFGEVKWWLDGIIER